MKLLPKIDWARLRLHLRLRWKLGWRKEKDASGTVFAYCKRFGCIKYFCHKPEEALKNETLQSSGTIL